MPVLLARTTKTAGSLATNCGKRSQHNGHAKSRRDPLQLSLTVSATEQLNLLIPNGYLAPGDQLGSNRAQSSVRDPTCSPGDVNRMEGRYRGAVIGGNRTSRLTGGHALPNPGNLANRQRHQAGGQKSTRAPLDGTPCHISPPPESGAQDYSAATGADIAFTREARRETLRDAVFL